MSNQSSRHGKLWKEHGRVSGPRYGLRDQSPEEQDKEAAALRDLEAPFPLPGWEPAEYLRRTWFPRRSWWEPIWGYDIEGGL